MVKHIPFWTLKDQAEGQCEAENIDGRFRRQRVTLRDRPTKPVPDQNLYLANFVGSKRYRGE
jgi:hypothetical protein